MARYEVTSDEFTRGKLGATIESDDLPDGINVDALVQGGHLKPVTTTTAKTKPATESETS